MTTEEREMILNLSYQELKEKFKNEPQKVIKFLQYEQKKDIGFAIIKCYVNNVCHYYIR